MVEISHLVKKYGDHVAVDDLSMTIEPGRIYGFLGPNGAGKSSTMNVLTGYLGATSGEVRINGHDIFKEPEEAKRCIGYLPEQPPLYMDMTVREYLNFVADLKKLEKSQKRRLVAEAMETTKITEMSGRLIKNLSKGYRQRVGFAQAILGYPDIIVLDEPTVGLDPKQITEMRDLIKSLGQRHTVLLSSHILTEVSSVCDYVFIISRGKLVADDTTENLLERMSGDQRIELLIKGDHNAVNDALREVEQIASLEYTQSTESGVSAVTVTAKKGEDMREALFREMSSRNLPILQMQPEQKSLEDIFLELTQEGGKKKR